MPLRNESTLLRTLRQHGAVRLREVRFRANRSTIWSLTQEGRRLNLHDGYREAPESVVRAFAVIARDAHRGGRAYREAAEKVRTWPGVGRAVRRVRATHQARLRRQRGARCRGPASFGPCCATVEQRAYLDRLYHHLNVTRFDGRLPRRIPLRLSNRMRTSLGQMVPGVRGGRRVALEIALNVDLMLAANERHLMDTMLHEMAHVADYLFHGEVGHGASWCRWAKRAGCEPRPQARGRFYRRPRGWTTVDRVPPLPRGWWRYAA